MSAGANAGYAADLEGGSGGAAGGGRLKPNPEPFVRFRDNPLLIAQTRRRLRGKQAIPTLAIAAIFGLCGLLFTSLATSGEEGVKGWNALCYTFLALIGVSLYLRGTSNVVNTMTDERRTGLLDFHRATPTTPMTDVLGYMLGSAAREYAAVAILLPFLLMATLASTFGLVNMLVAVGAILLSAWLYHAFAMLTGLTINLQRGVAGGTLLILFVLLTSATRFHESGLVVLAYLTPLPVAARALGTDVEIVKSVPFFGISLHPIVYMLLVQGSMLFFLLWANTRKLRRAESPGLSRAGAFGLFITLSVLYIGGAWQTLTGANITADGVGFEKSVLTQVALLGALYLSSALFLSSVLILSLAPNYLEVKRALRRALRQGSGSASWRDDGGPAWPLIPAFGGLTLAGFAVLCLGAWASLPAAAVFSFQTLQAAAGVCIFLAFVVGAAEYVQLSMRKSWKSGALFIVFAAFILPWMLAGIAAQTPLKSDGALFVGALSPAYGLALSIAEMFAHWVNDSKEIEAPGFLTPASLLLTAVVSGWFLGRSASIRATMARDLPLTRPGGPST